jgi:hypothetical protein
MTKTRPLSVSAGNSFDLFAPGLYAWAVTVAWPASQRLAPFEARLFALTALTALVVGAGLAFVSPLTGRIAGIWIFLAACFASWVQMAPSLFLARLDPLQGVLGSFGWGLFALSWARQDRSVALPAVETDPIPVPRQRLPWRVPFILALVSLAAALPMILAWWVKGLERALVAHAVALAGAIALVTYAAEFADTSVRKPRVTDAAPPGIRLVGSAPALLVLCFIAVLGAAFGLLR